MIPRILVDFSESLALIFIFFKMYSWNFMTFFGYIIRIKAAMRKIIDLIMFGFILINSMRDI